MTNPKNPHMSIETPIIPDGLLPAEEAPAMTMTPAIINNDERILTPRPERFGSLAGIASPDWTGAPHLGHEAARLET